MREGKHKKRTDIQALRAIAVLAVILYHLWPNRLVGGFMGVDMFFVISGYLMTLTIMRDINPVLAAKSKTRATWDFLTHFYVRRIKRLIPAASVTLTGTLVLAFLTGSYAIIAETGRQVFSSALFFQNWRLAADSVDYLASSTPPTAVQHFWSLSLEEQFYLVWPILLLILFFALAPISVLYKKDRISGAILPTILFTLIFFAYGFYLTKADPAAAYFNTFARVWELLIGAVIAFLPKLKNYDLKLLLPWLGITLCAYAIYRWGGEGFPGWHALLPSVGTALILYGGTGSEESKLTFTNFLKAKPIQWIGDASYSLYLWHWPLIILLPVLLSVNMESSLALPMKLGILVLSFIIAGLSYRFVEIPAQRIQLQKRWIYGLFVLLVGGIGAGGLTLSQYAKSQAEVALKDLHAQVLSDDPCLGARAIYNQKECGDQLGRIDDRFMQTATSFSYFTTIADNITCDMYQPDEPTKAYLVDHLCYVGDPDGKHTVAVWGDSHARQWANALHKIGMHSDTKFTIVASGSCATISIEEPGCADRLEFIKKSGALKNSDSILISLWNRHNSSHPDQPTLSAVAYLQEQTTRPIYLLEDIPAAGNQGGPLCYAESKNCLNNKEAAVGLTKETSKQLTSKRLLPSKRIIPTDDMFCDDTTCYSSIGRVPVYADNKISTGNSHLTAAYSLTLAELLQEKLIAHGVIQNPKSKK